MHIVLRVSGYPAAYKLGKPLTFSTRFDLALLVYLAMNPIAHSRQKMARLLWPDIEQERALCNLRSSLTRLRINFADWLNTDRGTVTFLPDKHFTVDTSGNAALCDGLKIGLAFNAWVEAIQYENRITVPDLPDRWMPQARSESVAIADFCRGHLDALIYRREGLWKFERAYTHIVSGFVQSPDVGDRFMLGTTIFNLAMLTGSNVAIATNLLRNSRSGDEVLTVGSLFAQEVLAAQYGLSIDHTAVLSQAESVAKHSIDPMVVACFYGADAAASMHDGNYVRAAESIQIALPHCLQARGRYYVRMTIQAAHYCHLAGQQRAARAYLSLAQATVLTHKSYHLLDRIDAISEMIDHA